MAEDQSRNVIPTDLIRSGERERKRLREKIREQVKKNLKGYITEEAIIGRQGDKLVKVPIKGLRLPRFVHDWRQKGGVGQGEGEDGQPVSGQPGQGDGQGAGNAPGGHVVEAEFTPRELAEILGESLELPNIEDRGKKRIKTRNLRFTDLRRVGPEATLDVRRTVKNAIARKIGERKYQPGVDLFPVIEIEKEDKRHKVWETVEEMEACAVVIAMMDISGSMGKREKEIVRTEMFWIETWLRHQYDGLEIVYIVHDTTAKEVDNELFYKLSEGGGTNISSALILANEIIDTRFSPLEFNIYPFYFSDGDNWSSDNEIAVRVIREQLLRKVNLFCYGQVDSSWGSGSFMKVLTQNFSSEEKVMTSRIRNMEGVLDSIRDFLGKGR